MMRINHLALRRLVTRIYRALGLSEDKASLLSDSLVMADLWGQDFYILQAPERAEPPGPRTNAFAPRVLAQGARNRLRKSLRQLLLPSHQVLI